MDQRGMERDVGLATPVSLMPNGGGLEHNSTGDSVSMTSPSLIRDGKVQSRYLSPHMGSCHDLCKYGKKDVSDAESRRLNFRKFREKNLLQDGHGGRDQVTILVPGERRMRTTTKATVTSKEMKVSGHSEGLRSQTSLSMKNTMTSGEKKTFGRSLENEQRQKANLIKGEITLVPQNKSSLHHPSSAKLDNLSPASDMNDSEKSNIIKEKNNSSISKQVSPVVQEAIQRNTSSPITKTQNAKQKVSLPPKSVDSIGKPAISLKTKTPLIRSISQRKALRNLTLRRNLGNKIIRSLGTLKTGGSEGELLELPTETISSKSSQNPLSRRNHDNKTAKSLTSKSGERQTLKLSSTFISSEKPRDGASSLQPVKLRSIKTSSPHDSVSSLKPRQLRSIMKSSTSKGSVSNLQPRKLRSTTTILTPQDGISTLQPRRLRSIKRSSTPHDSVSSSQPRKLWNVKLMSTPGDSALSLLPRKLRSLKHNSSVKVKDKVEKTNTIDSESGNTVADPDTKLDESESATTEVSDEEIESSNDAEVSEDDKIQRMRRAAATPPEDDTSSTPFKLKFRRGKVINLRTDSIGARRLWFSVGMFGGDNVNGNNGQEGKASFRKKEDNASSDSKDPDSEAQSVVLKHQNANEKKDGLSLFNDVIEETASKLAETRKSKVKALVGAFETVISLQESKPASAV